MKSRRDFGLVRNPGSSNEYKEYLRIYASMTAMQGLTTNRGLVINHVNMEPSVQFSELIAKESIRIADELIRQLKL